MEGAVPVAFTLHKQTDRQKDFKTLPELRQFAALVENSLDFIGIASINGQVLYVNEAGKRLVGLESADDVTKTFIFDYVMEEGRKNLEERVVPALLRNRAWKGVGRLKHFKTGKPIPVEVHSFITGDSATGEPLHINTIIRPLGGRKNSALLSETVCAVYQKLTSGPVDDDASAILLALSFIEQNLGERLTLDRIAKTSGMSKYHFAKVFNTLVGTSPMSFVTRVRMESAKGMLKHGTESISEVAFKIGFNSASHFALQFKKLTGMTPTEYRSKSRKSKK